MIQGRVWNFGDHINTDLIIAGRYLDNYDMSKLSAHVMEDVDPFFAANVRPGDIIVAGRNFGCGSSREQAPLALKESGVAAVVAESFSRIFYRNAINVGLPLIVCPQCVDLFHKGDVLSIDLREGSIQLAGAQKFHRFTPLPPPLLELLEWGGLVPYMKRRLNP
ncbi:MAG: 3-isopropylmalate dehydratase [Candidatus Methanomethylophilaceae archaeon]|jgi:3-isopropylmalate dehydratase small subunit